MTNPSETHVLLTRRRWNAYMLPFLLGTVLIGTFGIWQTGQLRFAGAPLVALGVWGWLRWTTPCHGMKQRTILASPGLVVMLVSGVAAIGHFAAALLVDVYFFEHPLHAPLEPYHAILFAPTFVLIIAGAYWGDWIERSKRDDNV